MDEGLGPGQAFMGFAVGPGNEKAQAKTKGNGKHGLTNEGHNAGEVVKDY